MTSYNSVCRMLRPTGTVNWENPVWEETEELALSETVSGRRPALSTNFRMFYDIARNCFCVRFDCEDDALYCTMTGRDDPIYRQDVLEVFIAAENFCSYIELEASPTGVLFDAKVDYRSSSDICVDRSWDLHGFSVTASYDSAEQMLRSVWEIPLEGWRSPPVAEDSWRINFYRIDHSEARDMELSAWNPTGEPDFHIPSRFGEIKFI